jgi:hypothetical protein
MDEYWIGYDLGYDEGYVEKPSISAIMKGAATQGEEYSKGYIAGFVEGFMARPGVDWYKFLTESLAAVCESVQRK